MFRIDEALDEIKREYKKKENKVSELIGRNLDRNPTFNNEKKKLTNLQWIKNMNDEEFIDYLLAIYVAGKAIGKNSIDEKNVFEDYKVWLNKEHIEN